MTRVVVDRIETQQDTLRFGDPIGCHYHWLEPGKVDSYGDSVRRLAAKVELAVAKGKKSYDKRHALRERQDRREADRAMSARRRGED